MPENCAVYGCFNTKRKTTASGSNIRYFRFPRDEASRQLWKHACRRADQINPENARICSIHFSHDDISDDMKSRLLGTERPKNQRILKKGAIPSLFLPNGNEKSLSAEDTREQLEPHHATPSCEDMDESHCSELIEKDDQGYMKKEDVKNVMHHLQKAMQIIKNDSNQDQRVKLHNQVQNVFNIYHDLYYGSAPSKGTTIFRMEGDVTDSVSSINTTATISGKNQDASKEWGVEDGKDSLLNDDNIISSGGWYHHPLEVIKSCEEAPSPEQQERQSASGEVSVTSPVSEYILVKRDVLLELASGSSCDTCRRGRPTSTITAQSGMAKKIVVKCFSCKETIEKCTSDKAKDKQGYEINWKMTNFALKNKGYMTLEELAETVQIKAMGQSVFHEIVSQIEDVEIQEEKFSESKEWVQYKLQNGSSFTK